MKRMRGSLLAVAVLALLACAGTGSVRQDPGTEDRAAVGSLIFSDPTLSQPAGQSCATCHDPGRAFTDGRGPDTSEGVIPGLFGARNAPTAAYAAFAPAFHWDAAEGLYFGGQFLDGRAATLRDQAQGPPLNPIEMHNPDRASYVAKVAAAPYADRLRALYGADLFTDEARAFDAIADAVATFERSPKVSPFTSKYDAFLKGADVLTARERRGLALFEGRGGCAACHPNTSGEAKVPPLFTDFSYDNLGVPRNPANPFYAMPSQVNPDGAAFVDLGLGGNPTVIAEGRAAESRGKFKVPTLRNVARTAPYFHNGAFRTLKEVVAFYNRRDLEPARFGAPEVPENVNRTELGNLGLSDSEEDDLVAFLQTLTDGYRP